MYARVNGWKAGPRVLDKEKPCHVLSWTDSSFHEEYEKDHSYIPTLSLALLLDLTYRKGIGIII